METAKKQAPSISFLAKTLTKIKNALNPSRKTTTTTPTPSPKIQSSTPPLISPPPLPSSPPPEEVKDEKDDSDNDSDSERHRRGSDSMVGTRISQPDTPGSQKKERSYSFSVSTPREFSFAKQFITTEGLDEKTKEKGAVDDLTSFMHQNFFTPKPTKAELRQKEEQRKRDKLKETLILLGDPKVRLAEKARQRGATRVNNSIIRKMSHRDQKDQEEVYASMSEYSDTEQKILGDAVLMEKAHTQLRWVAQSLTSTLSMFMFHPVPKEVKNRTDETLFNAYITALRDRLIVHTVNLYEFLHCLNTNTLHLTANSKIDSLHGYQEDAEGSFHEEVITFIKDHQPIITDKLEKAVAKPSAEIKEEEADNPAHVPDAISEKGNDHAILWCIDTLAKNNILSSINAGIKDLLVDQLKAYIKYMLPYIHKKNLAAQSATKNGNTIPTVEEDSIEKIAPGF